MDNVPQQVPSIDKNAPLKIDEIAKEQENVPLEKTNNRLFILGIIIFGMIMLGVIALFVLYSRI